MIVVMPGIVRPSPLKTCQEKSEGARNFVCEIANSVRTEFSARGRPFPGDIHFAEQCRPCGANRIAGAAGCSRSSITLPKAEPGSLETPLNTYSKQRLGRQVVEGIEYCWHKGFQRLEPVTRGNEDYDSEG